MPGTAMFWRQAVRANVAAIMTDNKRRFPADLVGPLRIGVRFSVNCTRPIRDYSLKSTQTARNDRTRHGVACTVHGVFGPRFVGNRDLMVPAGPTDEVYWQTRRIVRMLIGLRLLSLKAILSVSPAETLKVCVVSLARYEPTAFDVMAAVIDVAAPL